ncbi:MAG: hypothetical protein PWQ10_237 [Patescibacteria group bacterium]|nr:hypothetical protein [Patescibacteria group bacterium]
MQKIIRVTLSGSFHRDIDGLRRAYNELALNQCQILSPHKLDFEDSSVLFVRDVSEKNETNFDLEKHHLLAISQSDFLWIHAANGYIGVSTAMEVGYATALNIPVFSSTTVEDQTIAMLIKKVSSVFVAIETLYGNNL